MLLPVRVAVLAGVLDKLVGPRFGLQKRRLRSALADALGGARLQHEPAQLSLVEELNLHVGVCVHVLHALLGRCFNVPGYTPESQRSLGPG